MLSVRFRLSLMMFLQYAIWGAWAPFLWPYLTASVADGGLAMSNPQAAFIFGLLWLMCILAPFTGGQIADRYVPTQWFLALAHLVGGVCLIAASRATDYSQMVILMGIYSLMYAPTLALTNSLAFHHLESEKDFGTIRVFGTLGWICAGLILTLLRKNDLVPVGMSDVLVLSGIFSIVMAIYCLTLPHTPPARDAAADPLAFREAFVLLKNRNFAIFLAIAFVVTTELQFYYGPTAGFLVNPMGISNENVPMVMAVAQVAELFAMFFVLKYALSRFGLRKTLALGVIAWPLRYIVFALGPIAPDVMMVPVVASLALHGLGYTFFFVASQIYVDMVAPKDIRASAQSLLTLATLGVGNWLGTMFTGWVLAVFKPEQDPSKWTQVFLVPCALTIACAIAFLLFFKDPEKEAKTAPA